MPNARKTSALEVLDQLYSMDFRYVTGVPCSFLTPLINGAMSHGAIEYISSNQEGEAMAISAGLWLAGQRCLTLSQNSGLGNMVNPITSLLAPFRIPALLMLTWRGRPGIQDEPQHALMGAITPRLLALMEMHWQDGAQADFSWQAGLIAADRAWEHRERCAIVLDGDAFTALPAPCPRPPAAIRPEIHDLRSQGAAPQRHQLLSALLSVLPAATAVVSCTGKCSRELYALSDRAQHFYMTGSMGFAAAVALGVALGRRGKVIALDGDGALLMRLGNLATIGASRPQNLVHILFDNGCHDSTGGQPTVSPGVDFCAIAAACGYRHAIAADCQDSFERALALCETLAGPVFVHARVLPGSLRDLPRPDDDFAQLAQRFREFCRLAV